MATISFLSFSAVGQCQSSDSKFSVWWTRSLASNFHAFMFSTNFSFDCPGVKATNCSSCLSTETDVPTISETKLSFLKVYKRPIPSTYNNVLQELIVQQHLMRYKRKYCYDAVFALGFVTVYDQLMECYASDEDRDTIFKAYIEALEDPEKCRIDAQKLEDRACAQTASTLVDFPSVGGEVEGFLKDIAERAGGKGSFSYSRFFALSIIIASPNKETE